MLPSYPAKLGERWHTTRRIRRIAYAYRGEATMP